MKRAEKVLLIPEEKYSRLMDKLSSSQITQSNDTPQTEENKCVFSTNAFQNQPDQEHSINDENDTYLEQQDNNEYIQGSVDIKDQNTRTENINNVSENCSTTPTITPLKKVVNIPDEYKPCIELPKPNDVNNQAESYVFKRDLKKQSHKIKWLKF